MGHNRMDNQTNLGKIIRLDTKYAKICEICGAKKVKIFDWYICMECFNKYRRHTDLYGYATEDGKAK